MKTILLSTTFNETHLDFDIFLYNRLVHLQTQTNQPVQTFIQYRNNKPITILRCVVGKDHTWISPPKAPFGSIQHTEKCSIEEIELFIQAVVEIVRNSGAPSIKIMHYAQCYLTGKEDIVGHAYLNQGFKITTQSNYHIPVTKKLFEKIIAPAEKRRLKKCLTANFKCAKNFNIGVNEIYNFLYSCRLNKQYNLSLSETQLSELLTKCPDDVTIYTVKDQDQLIALSVTVRVHEKIIYHFLTESSPEYNAYSPTVFLIQHIYNYCQDHEIEILDLGTVVDHDGNEKIGLARFKENVGGIKTTKSTFTKQMAGY